MINLRAEFAASFTCDTAQMFIYMYIYMYVLGLSHGSDLTVTFRSALLNRLNP